MNHLMEVHFPGSTSVGLKGENDVFFRGFAVARRKVDYVTLARVLDAISSLRVDSLPRLRMGTCSLDYSDTVKYLGFLLDSKLTFGPHIKEKTKKAIRLLYKFRTSVGQLWGPNPFLTRRVLTGIVRPKIMYGAIVWANRATNYKKHLDRVQRLGLLAMVHVQRSTPTAGLEAILDVMLLDLHAQCAAVKAVLRVWDGNQRSWDGISLGHL